MTTSGVHPLVQASRLGEQGASMLCVALALAAGGFSVLPVGADKVPLISGGFRSRSADEAQVRAWWAEHPEALPAIVPGDGNLAALDVDSAAAAQVARDAGVSMSGGFIVGTGGTSAPFMFEGAEWPPMHVYVATATEPKVRGVVVRYKSGYVIAPGARRGDRKYRVLHDGDPAVWSGVGGSRPTESVKGVDEARLARVQAAVDAIPNTAETNRDQYVARAHMIKAAGGEGGRQTFLDWAARWPGGSDPVEDARVWDTLPLTTRFDRFALFHLAARHGFDAGPERLLELHDDFADDPPPVPVAARERTVPLRPVLYESLRDIHEDLQGTVDALERQAQRAEALGGLKDAHVPYRTLEELLEGFSAPHRLVRPTILRPGPALRDALAVARPPALVPGYLYRDAQHVLFGAPGSYKTFLALDWALHLASGRPWQGRRVQPGGVVFFAGEGTSRLLVRMGAWFARHGMSVTQAAQVPFAIIDTLPTLGLGEDGLQDAIARVQEALPNPRLVVFDNLTRMAAQSRLSTVDPGDLGQLLAGVDALGRVLGASTLLIAHSPMSKKNKVAGSYPIMANPDVVIQATKDQDLDLTMKLEVKKTRDGAPPRALTCTLERQDARGWVQAGFKAEGLPVPPSVVEDDFTDDVAPGLAPSPSLTSLVVVGAESTAALATAAQDAAVRGAILTALAAAPLGLAKTELRERVSKRRERVNAVLEVLTAEGVITLARDGPTHRYALAPEALSLLGSAPVAG